MPSQNAHLQIKSSIEGILRAKRFLLTFYDSHTFHVKLARADLPYLTIEKYGGQVILSFTYSSRGEAWPNPELSYAAHTDKWRLIRLEYRFQGLPRVLTVKELCAEDRPNLLIIQRFNRALLTGGYDRGEVVQFLAEDN